MSIGSNRPRRFALIGCGRIAKNHARPLQEIAGTGLVAVCDINEARATAAGAEYGVPHYSSYHEMLRTEDVDVVCILTPSGMHAAHTIDVIERYGKHIVVEKPMVLAWDDVERMERTAERAGVRIYPVYQNRYNRAVQRVRRDVLSGAFGRLVLGTVRLRWCRPQRYYDRDPWRGTWAMDGGALTNQGIHYLDLLLYLMGDVRSLRARIATQLVSVEVEDTAVATLTFDSGALGVIEVTTAARPDDFEASISVLGEHGTAVLTGIACNELSVYTLDPSARDTEGETFPDAYGFGHWPFYADVVRDLRGESSHPLSMAEGSRAIRLLNAVYRSAEDDGEIEPARGARSRRLGQPDAKLSALYETPAGAVK